jgi:uncharacterized protein (TIGR02145 family)
MLLDIVKQIVTKHGEEILFEPKRVSAFFSDMAKDEPKFQKLVFIECLEQGVVRSLKNVAEEERANCKEILAKRLHAEERCDIELCREAIDIICVVLFGNIPESTEDKYNEAVALYNEKQYIEAVQRLKLLAERDHANAQLMLGKCYVNGFGVAENYIKAEELFRKVAEHGNIDAESEMLKMAGKYVARGTMYKNKGDYDQAIANYTKAINLDHNYMMAYDNRGDMHCKKGDYGQAIADYTKAISIDPSYMVAYSSRGNAYYNKGNYNDAIADYTKVIRFNPKDSIVYNNRGNAYYYNDDYNQAIADYTKAIDLDPNSHIKYNCRGNAYYNKGDFDQAIMDYTKAISLEPKAKIIYNNRGLAYANKGDFDHAVIDYTKAISLDPNYKEAYDNRSNIWTSKGLCRNCGGKLDGFFTKKCKSCGGEETIGIASDHSCFTDSRDGNVYRTVKIGNQIWMADNLNYKMNNSWCYNDSDYGGKYGRLYTWAAAKIACPNGWHLPTRQEWDELVTVVGGSDVAGEMLKATNGWRDGGDGTDKYGFSALPGGNRYSEGNFSFAGHYGEWWTASDDSRANAYYRSMSYNHNNVSEHYRNKKDGFSVRCVKDNG